MQVKEVISITEKITIGKMYEDKNATHKQCHESHVCDTPCGGKMISCPPIPNYWSRTKRHLMCQKHIHNYWGALAWYEKENNLERNFDSKEIAFTKKEKVKI